MPKCKIKIKDLYLKDYFRNKDGSFLLIEFHDDVYCEFESGEEACKMKEAITRELAIPENEINVYMVE